jgi:acetolactate synthase-1/2/3 large subunit
MRGSEAFVELLEQLGVEVIFGLCGDTTLPLYEALCERRPRFRYILTRDERSASYMADAYARFSGRVGICEGPSGGGVTYILPGVVEANQSSVPVVAFTSDIDVRHRDRGTLTELDQDGVFGPLTRWTRTPSHAEQLPHVMREAFRRATSGRLGACHVGLPLNVQEGIVPDEDVYIDGRYGAYPAFRSAPDRLSVDRVADILVESRRPVIVAGAGVLRSEAWNELAGLVDRLGCPVATSISGKGAIAETDRYCLGVVGSNGGLPYRHRFIEEADVVFFVGCRAGSVTTDKWTIPQTGKTTCLQLDVDAGHIGTNYAVKEGIVGDARLGLGMLTESVADRLNGRRADKVDPEEIARARETFMSGIEEFQSAEVPIRPERFLAELFRVLPEKCLLVTDPGTPTPYFAAYYRVPQPGRWFAAPRAHGALGYALPATVGAYMARPKHKVIGIMGDGSFGITAGELETLARLRVPVVLIVLSNVCYGWIKAGQRARGSAYFAVDFSRTDHAEVARAYGLQAYRVEEPQLLAQTLTKAVNSSEPVLVDVAIQSLEEARAPVSKWVV